MATDQTSRNLLFILSDEHNRNALGCYGHPFVKTPNLDALAARGTRFASAYCNSPICVPSRASLATGRYVHEIGSWDNGTPYTGAPGSWHEMLREQGVDMVSIGKLHFRGGDDYGFTEELLPLHVVDGKGDLRGMLRKDPPQNNGTVELARRAGIGESDYYRYDKNIAKTAADWLARRAASRKETPFVLFVSFVMPHFPLITTQEHYDLYKDLPLEQLTNGLDAPDSDHPAVQRLKRHMDYDRHFDEETKTLALRAYFGMITQLDSLIGDVIRTLEETGLGDSTDILYTSDHGDNLGSRGMWGKSCMYEDSVAVPMILAGEGVPADKVVDTPVSLLDVAPTAFAVTGRDGTGEPLPGVSLIDLAHGGQKERAILSEYHAVGADTGQFMLRKGRWKYVAYVGERPQLFDLQNDPGELNDLWDDSAHQETLTQMDAALRQICDPEAVDRRAFAEQREVIESNGGRAKIVEGNEIPFTPAPA